MAAVVLTPAVLLLATLLRAARTVLPEKASTRELATSWAVPEELEIAAAWASLAVWIWAGDAGVRGLEALTVEKTGSISRGLDKVNSTHVCQGN